MTTPPVSGVGAWSDRTLRRVGWATWSLHAGVLVLGMAVTVAAPGSQPLLVELAIVLMAFAFPSVGLLIVVRQPRNRFGWFLLLGVGMAITVPALLESYTLLAVSVAPGSLPGGSLTAGLVEGAWIWPIGTVGIFVILLFPDGRLPSRHWRWLPPLALGTMLLIAVSIALMVEETSEGPVDGQTNPLFVEGLERPLVAVFPVALALLPACMVAAAVSLALRFGRARGVERQQLKWLAEAGVLVATCYLGGMVAQLFKPDSLSGEDPPWLVVLQNLAFASFALIPVAIGVALLRHRLYDIDRILNRTVVYAALTTALVGTYLVSVLLFRLLLDPVTGDSDLAVAGSTLAVAALFRPVRGRIQRAVDRRFYRSRYDAALIVEAFAARLGQEVDLDAVSTDLRLAVRETVHPAHLSLWLRESA